MHQSVNQAVNVSFQRQCFFCHLEITTDTLHIGTVQWQHYPALPLDTLEHVSGWTVQSVVVVFEVLQLQEVSGPFAALLHRRCEVGCLSGG